MPGQLPGFSTYMKTLLLLLLVISLIALSTPAFAYKVGNLDFNVRASASERYDSNINYANGGKSDYITTLAGGLDASYEGHTSSMALTGNIDQDIFALNPKFDNLSEDISFKYMQDLSKIDGIVIKDVLEHTYEPRSFEDALGRTTGRYSYFRNRLNVDYNRELSKQFSMALRYFGQIDIFSLSTLSDSYLNQGGGELSYYLNSQSIIFASYDFIVRKFSPGSDATTNRVGGGARQYFTDQLYFDVSGGADFIDDYDNSRSTNPYVIATITDDITEKTTVNASFRKEVYTVPYSQDMYNYWEISGVATSRILKRLDGSCRVFYGRGEYVNSGTTDDLFGLNAGATYEMTKYFNFNASYSYYSDISDVDARSYNKNVVKFSLAGKF